jgi:DNA-binding response OmpR family regulator
MKVIVLTADDAVREETMALGADAFLTKPLDLKQLSAAIKVVTGIAGLRRLARGTDLMTWSPN